MNSAVTHVAALVARVAVFVTGSTVGRNGLLEGLIPAVVLGIAAALLISQNGAADAEQIGPIVRLNCERPPFGMMHY